MRSLTPKPSPYDIASWILIGVALTLIFPLQLFSALMAGLLVYELIQLTAPLLHITRISHRRAKVLIVGLLAAIIVTLLGLLTWKMILFFRSGEASLQGLFTKMAEILDGVRSKLPYWMAEVLPDNIQDFNASLASNLRMHATTMEKAGAGIGLTLAHVVIGMILGAIVALSAETTNGENRPLAAALIERTRRIGEAFRTVVFAQLRISALNTLLTVIYLAVVLPSTGIRLPFIKTMVVITFFVGLLPVVGNLISNSIIIIVSLSVSFTVAMWSLAFLVLIHKLEYFLNARIVGGHINAKTWELLIAMLLMESAFGLAGLVAAPIYYAYIKKELSDRCLV